MHLSTLARGLTIVGPDPEITSISDDSRKIAPGGLFVAIAGTADDGHAYIPDAVRRGAVAIVGERTDGVPDAVARVHVADTRGALALLAARFYGEPASGLQLVGFTGTFGKTSTSEVLRALLAAAGARVGVLGSLGARYNALRDESGGLTSPAPVELHRALRRLRDAGAESVIMEVTSHALRLRRAEGLIFSGGLLAAIKPGEHTDFHRTYEDYVAAKRLFLDYLSPGCTLAYDADNRGAARLATGRREIRAVGFSLEDRPADLMFRETRLDASGARFRIEGPLARGRHELSSALLGTGHLRNVALALTYALAAGVELETASRVLEALEPLPRRMESYGIGGRTILDDTAAHPESFRAAFAVAASIPHERLVVVYAVRGKRGADINALNGDALGDLSAEHMADALILTTSGDVVPEPDRVAPDELDAASTALARRGQSFTLHDTLRDALAHALDCTGSGDLILLVGAQGMNEGKRMLCDLAGHPQSA